MDKLTFTLNANDYDANPLGLYDHTPNDFLALLLKLHKPQILEWLSANYPDIKDWSTYEGGIDSWWGFGSVFAFELGLTLSVEYHAAWTTPRRTCGEITVTIS